MQIEHLEKDKVKIEEKLMLLRSAVSETTDISGKPYKAIWNSLEQNTKEFVNIPYCQGPIRLKRHIFCILQARGNDNNDDELWSGLKMRGINYNM